MQNILSSTYFGNLHYFSKILSQNQNIIDYGEHFCKQTYRNRCNILGANGVLTLSVPTIKVHNSKQPMRDVQIDYATDWQKQHLRSIISAYKNSAYFDYFFDIYADIFEKKEQFLIDLNEKTLQKTLDILSVKDAYSSSDCHIVIDSDSQIDYRNIISPKSKEIDENFTCPEYYQVFSEKMDFQANLSILDLIFCEGLQTKNLLKGL